MKSIKFILYTYIVLSTCLHAVSYDKLSSDEIKAKLVEVCQQQNYKQVSPLARAGCKVDRRGTCKTLEELLYQGHATCGFGLFKSRVKKIKSTDDPVVLEKQVQKAYEAYFIGKTLLQIDLGCLSHDDPIAKKDLLVTFNNLYGKTYEGYLLERLKKIFPASSEHELEQLMIKYKKATLASAFKKVNKILDPGEKDEKKLPSPLWLLSKKQAQKDKTDYSEIRKAEFKLIKKAVR